MNEYKKFIDSRSYPISDYPQSDIDFLSRKLKMTTGSKPLIKITGNTFETNFVGEIITPNNKYFSVPKNFPESEIELFKKVLNKYATIKGKSIIENNTFIISPSGKMESEKYYYKELKSFFLDYITYEFIYPKKRIKKHSTAPISGGKIDIALTDRFREQRGPGITYNVKDFKNSDDWRLDDIYWSVISYLADKYNDRREIDEMFNFLDSEGFDIKKIDISDADKILKEIDECEVGIIHNPIKETLISYFKSKSVNSTKYTIKVFYTDNFAFVWEEMVRMALKENKYFRNELKDKFERKRSHDKWFSSNIEIDEFIKEINKHVNKIKEISRTKSGTGIILKYEIDAVSRPDLFSEWPEGSGKRFIGDAKYYNDPEGSEYEKEFITYNRLSNNEYPMLILVPGLRTISLDIRREESVVVDSLSNNQKTEFELIIFKLSIKDVIDDAVNDKSKVIDYLHMLLWTKEYTKRSPIGSNP